MSTPPVPTVETERMILRGFRDDDHAAYTAMRADPEVVRYLIGGEALIPFAEEIAASRIAAFNEGWRRGYGVWAVEDRVTGQLIGQAGLARLERSEHVEVLYAFAKPWWGRGRAREAARAALRFGFETAGLDRIVGFVVPENAASARVLEVAGLRSIGTIEYNGFSVLGYAITAEEWRRTS
ncbi:MAG: GNAT family N-acetyltransferase [Alphaproteobacteria bacterium]|nr:GNAT family N-acetyltransferase [Alphaproteobacteria bacterium]